MAFGAARLNGLGKASVVVVAEVIRRKLGIAASGNAQVSTAQSQFGGSSYLGDGTGDFLTVTPRVNLTHTGTWTIECWARITSFPADGRAVIQSYNLGSPFNGFGLQLQASSFFKFWDGSNFRNFNSSIATGTWYHLAIVSTAGSVKMYQNGVQQTTTFTLTTAFNNTTNNFTIGAGYDGSLCFNGHIDEVRISDSARYTTGFTPSTTPFVNDANTVLLLHMSGTNGSTYFEDDNGIRTQQSIRAIGNAQISTAQSQFGGSSYLGDGTGDYLIVANDSSLAFGTTDFTIEFWVRTSQTANATIFWDQRPSGSQALQPTIYMAGGGTLYYYTNSANRITGSNLATNTWYHIAVSRSGTSTRMFLNGTQVGSTYSDSNNYVSSSAGVTIAADQFSTGSNSLNGYIDEVRVSNSARYTANFTAPTAPFTNDANTVLLLHCDGTNGTTVFRDDNGDGRTSLGIRAIGNAQVDTAQSYIGGSSLLLDGTGDYLSSLSSLSLGTGSFTIECWCRVPSLQASVILDNRSSDQPGVFTIQANGTLLYFDPTVGGVSTSGTYTANTWFHACFERSGNTFRMYINGTASYTNTNFTSNLGTSRNVRIGISYADTSGVNGWIDELRISSSARYNGNFTPSTTPFQNDANTLLLLHMDGTDASTVFVDDNGKRPT